MLHRSGRAGPVGRRRRRGGQEPRQSGSSRPSSLLYTYGPGAIMDLPGFSVMPAGLDDWEPIWKRREDSRDHRAPVAQCDLHAPRSAGGRAAALSLAAGSRTLRQRGCRLGHPRTGIPAVGFARAVTTSARCHGSATPTPIPSAPISRSSLKAGCPGCGSAVARRLKRRARPYPAASADMHQRSRRRALYRTVGVRRGVARDGRAARPEDA